jgi:hypothetical protein
MPGITDMLIPEGRDPVSGPVDGENSWRSTFLAALEASGNVSASARRAGVGRATAYRHRQAESEFRSGWDQAIEVATDLLEGEARRRALEGWEEPVFYQGEICGHIRKYSDTLIMFLLKAYRPQFRDNYRVEHSGDTVQVEVRYVDDWRDPPAVAGDHGNGTDGLKIIESLGYVPAIAACDPATGPITS